MKKKILLAFLCATALMIDGSLMLAQERSRERRPSSGVFVSEGPSIEIQAEGGHFAWAQQGPAERATFEFAMSEMVIGKPVKGAPYSADAVTESIQMLADGNRIVQRNVATVYRDSEGRTRRDQTLKWRGGDSQAEERKTSFINDPVSGVSYTLHHSERTAFKVAARKIYIEGPGDEEKAKAMAADAEAKAKVEAETRDHMKRRPPRGDHPPVDHPEAMAMGGDIKIALGGPGFAFAGKMETKKESLGTQTIEGVQAEGTRVTLTIPAGEIGNEQPINIVSERWYSPELQVVVMTRRSDPRAGETTYRLTNINRSEPTRSLFEVPSDYTLREGPGGFGGMRRKKEM
ncbi:MAG: hypothetical protein AB1631_15260 [Acidobacteriota bacterium]